jgi:site-specific DNA recombinase
MRSEEELAIMDTMIVTPYDGCGKCLVGSRRLSRVSDATSSPQRQADQIITSVAAFGGHIIGWADDWETSGATDPMTREGLGAWLQGNMGPYSGIAAAAVDRIGRCQLDVLLTGRQMTVQGKLLLTYGHNGPWDLTDATDEAMFAMLSIGAQMELRAIQKRNREDTIRARKNGEPKQMPSYGYRYVRLTPTGKVDHVAIDDVAAEIIRNVAERILTDTEGEITHYTEATRLNRQGIPSPTDRRAALYGRPPKGTLWSPRGLKTILTSEAALGYLMHQRRPVLDQEGKPRQLATPLWGAATRKALVEKTTAKRADPRSGKRAPKGERLLAGRAYCGNCGARLTCSSVKGGRTYRCEARSNGVPSSANCEPSPNIFMRLLDKAVEEWFLAAYGSKQLFHKVHDAGTGYQARIMEIEANRSRLRDDREAGLYDDADDAVWFRTRYEAMGRELAQLRALPDRPAGMRWAFTGTTPGDQWREARDDVARRELLASYQVRVTLFPENDRNDRYSIHGLDADEESVAREAEAIAYQAELEARIQLEAQPAPDLEWEEEETADELDRMSEVAQTTSPTAPQLNEVSEAQ